MAGEDDKADAHGLSVAVAYGLLSAMTVFAVSTAVTWLVADRHPVVVWLASASVVTVVSCAVSDPVLSRVAPSAKVAKSRRP